MKSMMTTMSITMLSRPKMARDLNNFFAAHRRSHARYISSIDALFERYDDVIQDEMDSVIDLSSCKIVKDKKGAFSRDRYIGSMVHHLHDKENSSKHKLKENREKRETLSVESYDESDTDQENVDFEVLKDVSSCIASFLEVEEPEPSDAETLSSVSSDSYETVLSEYEDDTIQGSTSQEDHDFESIDKPKEEENIYDEIDGGSLGLIHKDTSADTPISPTILSNNPFDRGHRNAKNVERRSDETFIIEDRQNSNVNRIYEKFHGQNDIPQFHNENCNIQRGNINRRDYFNFPKSPPERMKVKRVSTEYTSFSDLESKGNDGFVSELDHVRSPYKNKHDRENTKRDLLNEKLMFSKRDPWYQDEQTAAKERVEDKTEGNVERLATGEFQEKGGDAVSFPNRQSMEWLHRKFSPKQWSEQKGIPKNDLSPSHRKRGSKAFLNILKNLNSEHDSPGSNREKDKSFNRNFSMKIVTPFHHRQAKQVVTSNFKPSSLQRNEGFSTISNETECDSVHEDNRSSKKDSGFSTLHDESLTVDTPLYEEVQEALTSENLDSFNKSLAEQSGFVNVSVNCSHGNVEDKTDKVEKWLHNVSVEMEKDFETTLDRKVDRISEEMCRHSSSGNSVMAREMESNIEGRLRHNSAEVPKITGVILDTVVSKSCQPLWKSPSLNRDIGQEVKSEFINEGYTTFGRSDRHIVKGHRNLSSNVRLEKEKIADILSLFSRKNAEDTETEVKKQRHLGVSGKRLIESPGDRIYADNEIEEMPTRPKSRKLNLNGQNRFGGRNLNNSNECDKILHHKRYDTDSEYCPERIQKNGFPMEKQEMVAYMVPRGFPKKLDCDNDVCRDKKQAGKKSSNDKHVDEDFYKEIKSPHLLPGHKFYNINKRNEFAYVVKENLQEKKKSPSYSGRSFNNQGTKITHVDQRKVHTPKTYQANQYEVNQSYIRKLKMNAEVKGQECGFEHHYAEKNNDRNVDFDEEERFDNQQYNGINRRQRQCQRKETREREEFNDMYADVEEYREFTEEDESDDREYSSHNNFQLYDQRQRGDCYTGQEKDMSGGNGRGDSRSGYSSKQMKDKRRKSRGRVVNRDMTFSFPHMFQAENAFHRNDSFNNNEHSLKRSSGRERYSQHNTQDSFYNVIHNEEEKSEIGTVSPRSEIKRYHMECHLGSPNRRRSRHIRGNSIEAGSLQGERNNSASLKGITSSFAQNVRKNQLDTGFRSPSSQDKGGFNSPVVDRANHASVNKVDEYSPSASLAKMRLNTPKSKLEARRKLSRSKSREDYYETNINYQKANSTRNEDLNDFFVDKNEMDDSNCNFENLEKETDEFFDVPYSAETQGFSSQRFVSLDQLRGMPLQLRIQQLESDHKETERHARGRPKNRNRNCSNEYISEDLSRDSLNTKDRQSKKYDLDTERSSNVYHKYCEIMNEKDQSSGKTQGNESTPESTGKHKIEKKPSDEPRMRKSLFSPVSANFRPVATSEIKKTLPQTCQGIDVFKTPMSFPVVARSKVKIHNKENENVMYKVSEQKNVHGPAMDESTRCRDRLSGNENGQGKLTQSQYMQSTPVKPGMHFTLNTTMSTIMGSDETEVNNDENEEIILI